MKAEVWAQPSIGRWKYHLLSAGWATALADPRYHGGDARAHCGIWLPITASIQVIINDGAPVPPESCRLCYRAWANSPAEESDV